MPNPENIKGHEFKPGQSGNPAGRPKSQHMKDLVKVFGSRKALKLSGFNSMDITAWEDSVMKMNTQDLQVLAKWSDCPAYPKGLAIAILFDMKNGTTKTLDKLRERKLGKPTNRIEMTGNLSFADFLMKTATVDDSGNQVKPIQGFNAGLPIEPAQSEEEEGEYDKINRP